MPKLDLTNVPVKTGSIYPEPYAAMMAGRSSLRLGEAGGLTQVGVNLVTLQPGALSSLRHWHLHEDEFVMVTQGECVMVQEGGETLMQVGDCAAFPAGVADGHHEGAPIWVVPSLFPACTCSPRRPRPSPQVRPFGRCRATPRTFSRTSRALAR